MQRIDCFGWHICILISRNPWFGSAEFRSLQIPCSLIIRSWNVISPSNEFPDSVHVFIPNLSSVILMTVYVFLVSTTVCYHLTTVEYDRSCLIISYTTRLYWLFTSISNYSHTDVAWRTADIELTQRVDKKRLHTSPVGSVLCSWHNNTKIHCRACCNNFDSHRQNLYWEKLIINLSLDLTSILSRISRKPEIDIASN